mgnify:CR=1 FL=1
MGVQVKGESLIPVAPVMWQVGTAEQMSDEFYCFLILARLLQQVHSLAETTGENSEAREPAEEAGEAYADGWEDDCSYALDHFDSCATSAAAAANFDWSPSSIGCGQALYLSVFARRGPSHVSTRGFASSGCSA